MPTMIRFDRALFVLLETILNGALFFILPNDGLPMWANGFFAVVINATVAYLISETPKNGSPIPPLVPG